MTVFILLQQVLKPTNENPISPISGSSFSPRTQPGAGALGHHVPSIHRGPCQIQVGARTTSELDSVQEDFFLKYKRKLLSEDLNNTSWTYKIMNMSSHKKEAATPCDTLPRFSQYPC
jgi:hypothetical protein